MEIDRIKSILKVFYVMLARQLKFFEINNVDGSTEMKNQ